MPRGTKKNTHLLRRRRSGGGNTPSVSVCVVHAHWCGHCKELTKTTDETGKTKWDQIKEKLDGKCEVIKYEQTEDEEKIEELVKQGLVVNGYPTIFKIVDGKIEPFKQAPDVDAIVAWALKGQSGGKRKRSNRATKKNWTWF